MTEASFANQGAPASLLPSKDLLLVVLHGVATKIRVVDYLAESGDFTSSHPAGHSGELTAYIRVHTHCAADRAAVPKYDGKVASWRAWQSVGWKIGGRRESHT